MANWQFAPSGPDPTSPILLDNKALKKVNLYREDYRRPERSDRAKAFLPAIMSTSGRIQGELLRLLFIISHRAHKHYTLLQVQQDALVFFLYLAL